MLAYPSAHVFVPGSGLNHACCACEALFVFVFAARSFFALSFCAAFLRPASVCLLVCFVFSLGRSQRLLLTLWLMYLSQGVACIMFFCFVFSFFSFFCKAVGVSAGRRFFALCLRGGSSPSNLAFSGVLSGLLFEQVFWRFARRFVLGFLPRSGLNHACACDAVSLSAGRRFFALCLRGGSSPWALLFAGMH